jgi:hypothetical protein
MARDKEIKNFPGSIIVDFEIDVAMVFLIIRNAGNSAALNLKIKPSAPIIGLNGNKDLRELQIFKEISYMAPLKEIKIFVDTYDSFFRHLKNAQIGFSISYRDENNSSFKNKITHDLKIYSDLIFFIKKS